MLLDTLETCAKHVGRMLLSSLLRGVIKKFGDWCDEIKTHLAMLTNFIGDIKQQKFISCENLS